MTHHPGPPKWWNLKKGAYDPSAESNKQRWLYELWTATKEIISDWIDSGDATAGQVLTADGAGGADWEDVAGYSYLAPNNIYDNAAAAAITPVSDITTAFDGNESQFDELNNGPGNPGVDVSVNFTGVAEISGLVLRAYYDGGGTHHTDVSFYNYRTSSNDIVIRLDLATDFNYRTILIPSDSDYISGGAAQVNFIHPNTGTAGHDGVFVDYVAIIESTDLSAAQSCATKCVKADYGAVGGGVVDDTQAFQDAADDGPNIKIKVPTDKYLITETINQNTESVYWEGEGGINSEILFNPTVNDICFSVRKTDASVYYRGGFKGLFFNSDDTTYEKTAIYLEDTSGIYLDDLYCHGDSFGDGWSDTGFGSVFLHTAGREFTVTNNFYLSADIGILIDQNPNTLRTQVLDSDHFDFHNTYITTTSGADTPCVRIADGVNLADMKFSGSNPWVRPGGHGFEWIDTANNNIASLNLVIDGVGFEQAGGSPASDYSIYIDKSGTNSIRGFNLRNFSTAVEINGIYLRNVKRVNLDQGAVISTFSGAVLLNADSTCDDINSTNVDWSGNTSDSVATLTGLEIMWALKKDATAAPLPENFHIVDSAADIGDSLPMREFSANHWGWSGTLADTVDMRLAVGVVTNRSSIITIWGYSSTGPIREGGILADDQTGMTIISGTSNLIITEPAGGTGDLGVYHDPAAGAHTRVMNDTGQTLYLTITVVYNVK